MFGAGSAGRGAAGSGRSAGSGGRPGGAGPRTVRAAPASRRRRRGGCPARAWPMMPGRWRSPTVTKSAAPMARWRVSADVHGPMPGMSSSRSAAASAGPSRRPPPSGGPPAPRAGWWPSAWSRRPARCHSQDGISAQVRGVRHDVHALGRARGGLAVLAHQEPPGAVGLVRGDLLLQDRGDQGLQHQTGTGQAQAGAARGASRRRGGGGARSPPGRPTPPASQGVGPASIRRPAPTPRRAPRPRGRSPAGWRARPGCARFAIPRRRGWCGRWGRRGRA